MAQDFKHFTFAVVGMGLIGGSYAKRLKDMGARVIGINRSAAPLKQALSDGAIDAAGEVYLKAADVVIFATPETVTEAFIRAHLSDFKSGAILTDAAGVKQGGAARIERMLENGCDFISAHPMAGREGSGYEMADGAIFDGANYILVPTEGNRPANLDFVEHLALALGCGHVARVSPAEHDRIIAYTSDVLHVIAASIMNSESFNDQTKYFTAGAFRDMTRIADINSALWTSLFLENKENVLTEIGRFRSALDRFTKAIEAEDTKTMTDMLDTSRIRKRGMTNGNDSRKSR